MFSMLIKPISAIVFDLDGVLVDSRYLHYISLNDALEDPYKISLEEHLAKYDGLPTKEKLNRLTKEKGLPIEQHTRIWKEKQENTFKLIKTHIHPDDKFNLLTTLKQEGYTLFCSSNSIRKTIIEVLTAMNILSFFTAIYSNEDVIHPKPHPNIYLKCFSDHGIIPRECMIVEDSPIGKTAAFLSGAHVCHVADPSQVKYAYLKNMMHLFNTNNMETKIDTRWNSKIQVIIPMAGAGSRFAVQGFSAPKPLIDIDGKPMIQWVIENLNLKDAKYIFIVRKSHLDTPRWNLKTILETIAPGCSIITTDKLTEGPACSVLLARDILDPELPLLIANSDQYLEWDANAFLYENRNTDGCISTFYQPDTTDKKWSYVRLNDHGFITEVKEKEPISHHASTGIYYWNRTQDFLTYADQMIAKNIRVNNEFYVAPIYNEAILDNKKIRIHTCKKMWGLGVPEDLHHFCKDYLHLDD